MRGDYICNVLRIRTVQAAVRCDRVQKGRERLEACRIVVVSAERVKSPQHQRPDFVVYQAVTADLAVCVEEVFTATQAIMIEHEGAVHVEEEGLKLINEPHRMLFEASKDLSGHQRPGALTAWLPSSRR